MPLIPAVGRQRQADVNSRPAMSTKRVPGQPGLFTQRNTVSKKTKQNKTKKKEYQI